MLFYTAGCDVPRLFIKKGVFGLPYNSIINAFALEISFDEREDVSFFGCKECKFDPFFPVNFACD
jgi:hypothetical protein